MRNLGAFFAILLTACGVVEESTDIGTTSQEACGTCDPDHINGRGIYNIEGGNYCFSNVCPNMFYATASGVYLLYYNKSTGTESSVPVNAIVNGAPVTLQSIITSGTWTYVRYSDLTGSHLVSGGSLGSVLLSIELPTGTHYLRFFDPGQPSGYILNAGVYEYNLQWRNQSVPWTMVCTDDQGATERASFYQGSGYDPKTAARIDGGAYTTVACRKGGIVMCMEWGYKPWLYATNTTTGLNESLLDPHNACIQMKRAAYCGTDSYTVNGTQFGIEDVFNIQQTPQLHLEAMWTKNGAACLNEDHRRRPDVAFPGCQNPLPTCGGDDPLWTWGKLASETNVDNAAL